jgi:hypothetical protein
MNRGKFFHLKSRHPRYERNGVAVEGYHAKAEGIEQVHPAHARGAGGGAGVSDGDADDDGGDVNGHGVIELPRTMTSWKQLLSRKSVQITPMSTGRGLEPGENIGQTG